MTQAAQGGPARHTQLAHSPAYGKMKRMRAEIGRDKLLPINMLEETGDWHILCHVCKQSIARITDGVVGYTYTLSELLSCAVAHYVECHEDTLTYEHYGEDYA